MQSKITVGYPRTKRISCRDCGGMLGLRTTAIKMSSDPSTDLWYHVKCFKFRENGVFNPEDLDGFDELKKQVKETFVTEFEKSLVAVEEEEAKKREKENAKALEEEKNDSPPTHQQIDNMRKEIFNESHRNAQADKEREAALVEPHWHLYSDHVEKNIHRIPRVGVEGLAKEFGVMKEIFEACVGKYFERIVKTCSYEVLRRFKNHIGFRDENLTEKDAPEKEDYYNQLEQRLVEAVQVIRCSTEEKLFTDICSERNINAATLRYLVDLFIAFQKSVLDSVSIMAYEESSQQINSPASKKSFVEVLKEKDKLVLNNVSTTEASILQNSRAPKTYGMFF
ncbi:hypothetical protein CTI12_AA046580 [Artemisia annua]|uniref:PARP-type domain-containing protein n=1 Tax=Artemisia annua TaxID=35608 RepID=A0A2U1QCS5_ARTAN|nr:hypothetical protein CTI12_AA046580 [Artemisia annua]